MESVILPCKSIPSISIPNRQELLSEFPPKYLTPTISINNTPHALSSSIKPDPRTTDHLSHLCRNGRLSEAISILDSITRRGSKVRRKTFTVLIQACIDANALQAGRKLHCLVDLVKNEDPFVRTKLVSLYALCGCLDDARRVFDGMRERNLFTWTAMIGAYSRERRWREVVDLFYLMMEEGIVPDAFLFTRILQACGKCGDVETGVLIHSILIRRGIHYETYIGNSILSVYAKCGKWSSVMRLFDKMQGRDSVSWNAVITGYCQNGEISKARRLFELMHEEGIERGLVTWNVFISSYNQLGRCDLAIGVMKEMESFGIIPDVFTWTSIISGFVQNNRNREALELFREMLLAGVEPNEVTLVIALSACASLKALEKGKELHSLALKWGLAEDVLIGNSLIDMYSKCREFEAARHVFDMSSHKDAYSWNSMIGGYCQAGYFSKAHDLFFKMRESGARPNAITWNVMITGYMENGDEDLAVDLFQRMEKDGSVRRDTASWNALIAGYLQNGQKNKAFGIFRQMQSLCFTPNSVTILSVLPACSNLVAAKKVKEIHCCVLRRNLDYGLSVANCLINTYAKSGNIAYSKAIFYGMSATDIITWNSLILGNVLHGCSFDALELFGQMKSEGFKPNSRTLVSVISAYGLAKMIEKAKHAFSSMMEECHILPNLDHYAAMVDLYGRSGRLEEALKLIEDMAIEPDFSVWASLLTACRVYGNSILAVHAAEKLLELEPWNVLVQHLVLQTHAICGISDNSSRVKSPGKRNKPNEFLGCSLIEIENTVHYFVAGDQSQPEASVLHSWIKNAERKMIGLDFYDGLCIEEEEKEEVVGVHSEKLAIAFALIKFPKSPSIRIVKNLRVCRNCHTAAKYISRVYHREIYIKDPKCLHHFKDGRCSCCDYW